MQVSNKLVVVVDDQQVKSYDAVGTITFSPDSKRVAYGAKVGEQWVVVVDSQEGKPYEALIKGGKVVFASPERLHYLAVRYDDFIPFAARGLKIYLIEEKIR